MSDQHRSGLAKFSFFLGFISLFFMTSVFTAIPGIIAGHMARTRAISFPHQYGGRRIAMLGLIMCYLSIALLIMLIAVGNYLHSHGDLMPLLDTIDSSNALSGYLQILLDKMQSLSSQLPFATKS